ncbi:MAG: patatin family protein [Massilibacteroides sp.]|nr:patatin family protein [Massilibacteroides sp.]MDD3063405.1 patatin family protein [Massilibacteroides sp.]MDD4115811.1 patatin family protein [Massilibacteroides sp.]MDD4659094.1 patatin family protein [Massilibacteroides sp.]
MSIDSQTGLVLEGGGMRCAFTAGVLDYFLDNNICFSYTIGVSAGASNGVSYISRQRGRSRYSYVELMREYKYVGLLPFLRGRGVIDMDFLFNVFSEKYYPFDYDKFFNTHQRFVIVTSNCLTGEAEYFEEKSDPDRLLSIIRASCSLPVMCPITYVDGIPMVDGGVCDSIPLHRSLQDGFRKNVVVLTRNKGYRKKEKDFYLPGFIYRKYPRLRQQLKLRYKHYNEQIDYVESLERKGDVLVIRPRRELEVTRTEKNVNKLAALYAEGYECAKQQLPGSGLLLL